MTFLKKEETWRARVISLVGQTRRIISRSSAVASVRIEAAVREVIVVVDARVARASVEVAAMLSS